MREGGWKTQGPGCLPVLSPAEFQKRLETQHVRSFQHYRGDSYWQMKTEGETGTSELFFSFERKRYLGDKKRMREPVHDSFTLSDDRNSESGERRKMKN